MLDEMTATLGGRAAEQVVFGKVSTGALNDLERVTKQAFAMVAYYGFSSQLGNISFYDSTGQQDYAFNKPFSEKTNEIIDKEVKALVEKCYKKAIKTLEDNREGLDKLANKLLEKEVIFSDDLENIFGKRPWGDSPALVTASDAEEESDAHKDFATKDDSTKEPDPKPEENNKKIKAKKKEDPQTTE
jgi:cell division protease FtsH